MATIHNVIDRRRDELPVKNDHVQCRIREPPRDDMYTVKIFVVLRFINYDEFFYRLLQDPRERETHTQTHTHKEINMLRK